MNSWRTTIGGAFSALGTALMGVGLVPQISEGPSALLQKIAIAGFIFNAAGIFCGHLFAADRQEVQKMIEKSQNDTKVTILGAKEEMKP